MKRRIRRAIALTIKDLKSYFNYLLIGLYYAIKILFGIVSRAVKYAYTIVVEAVKFTIAAAQEIMAAFS